MARKILAILLALFIVTSFCACNNGEENTTDGNTIDISTEDPNDTGDSDDSDTETDDTSAGADPGELDYTELTGTVYVVNPSAAVALRDGEYTWLAEVKSGTELQRIAISTNERWSKVIYDGEEVYIATRNLTTYNADDNDFSEVSKTLVAKVAINVRVTPQVPDGTKNDAESALNVVGQIAVGAEVKVVAEDAELGWYKIEFAPADGFEIAETVEGYSYEFFIKADPSFFEAETKAE